MTSAWRGVTYKVAQPAGEPGIRVQALHDMDRLRLPSCDLQHLSLCVARFGTQDGIRIHKNALDFDDLDRISDDRTDFRRLISQFNIFPEVREHNAGGWMVPLLREINHCRDRGGAGFLLDLRLDDRNTPNMGFLREIEYHIEYRANNDLLICPFLAHRLSLGRFLRKISQHFFPGMRAYLANFLIALLRCLLMSQTESVAIFLSGIPRTSIAVFFPWSSTWREF